MFKTEPTYTEHEYWKSMKSATSLLHHLNESQLYKLCRSTMICYDDILHIISKLANYDVASPPSSKNGSLVREKLMTGVLSNHSNAWFEHFAAIGNFSSVFSHHQLLFVSQTLGAAKPDPSIFEVILF